MDIKRIMTFLEDLSRNNNKEWFQGHRKEYFAVRGDFEKAVGMAIGRIMEFDPEISGIAVKDCMYRVNRDIRFSADKSPYKTHLGAYINAHGKKALRGGYYLHVEPGECLLAVGNYWLPTNILTSCRNEIMANTDEWLRCVKSEEFLRYFDADEQASWESPQGFGLAKLKTCPSGFPRDWEHVGYLRLKDYCCWHRVPDTFFDGDDWLDEMERIFKAGKPQMDFVNAVIDDYE